MLRRKGAEVWIGHEEIVCPRCGTRFEAKAVHEALNHACVNPEAKLIRMMDDCDKRNAGLN